MKFSDAIQADVFPGPKGTALVTGASSGIGRAYARFFAGRGYDLLVTGRREDKLQSLVTELEKEYPIRVEYVIAELSDEHDLNHLIGKVEARDNISVLVNNAGFGSGTAFCQCSLEDHLKMVNVHVCACIRLVHAVLPGMMKRNGGIIINISSLGAFAPAPGNSMYSGTKLFLKGFTESLHMEVEHYGIRVQCVCPGFTRTDFHERRDQGNNAGGKKGFGWMDAEGVVKKSMKALEAGKIVYVPGKSNKLLRSLIAMIPKQLYYKIMENAAAKKTEGHRRPICRGIVTSGG